MPLRTMPRHRSVSSSTRLMRQHCLFAAPVCATDASQGRIKTAFGVSGRCVWNGRLDVPGMGRCVLLRERHEISDRFSVHSQHLEHQSTFSDVAGEVKFSCFSKQCSSCRTENAVALIKQFYLFANDQVSVFLDGSGCLTQPVHECHIRIFASVFESRIGLLEPFQ